MPVVAERLQSLGVRPSLIIASSAKRTSQTARLLADTIAYPREFIHYERGLYLASAGAIADELGAQDDGFNVVLMCGHNPGMTSFANQLIPNLTDNMPTAACLTVSAPVKSWRDFLTVPAELISYDTPATLRGA